MDPLRMRLFIDRLSPRDHDTFIELLSLAVSAGRFPARRFARVTEDATIQAAVEEAVARDDAAIQRTLEELLDTG